MGASFRASMSGLHTWAGVCLGGLLFAIFWMGTLSVFDREIDRWMMPVSRLDLPSSPASLEVLRPFYDAAAAAKAPAWLVILPSEREPVFRITWRALSGNVVVLADPVSGAALLDPGSWAGTRFFYPFHYSLHIKLFDIGSWLVGAAAMTMLTLCVSGVIVHRKLFGEFFMFRARRQPGRLILDLHHVTGVLGLPFQIVIALSGLIVFWSVYFPAPLEVAYQNDRRAVRAELFNTFSRPRSDHPGALASLDILADEAQHLWEDRAPRYVFALNPGDAAAVVQLSRTDESSIGGSVEVAVFDAATGALLHRRSPPRPMMHTQRFIAGVHQVQFRHWTLRWLYFGLGLVSCATIVTGQLFWLESRRKRHAHTVLRAGVRVVEGLTVGSVAGIVIATLAFFVVNRVLPLGTSFLGQDRAALEIWTFYLAWLAAFAHAWLRPRRAWVEQCWAIAVLALTAVLLNWITTGDHLARSLSHRHLWPVAGMDLLLLIGAAMAFLAARRLPRRAPAPITIDNHSRVI